MREQPVSEQELNDAKDYLIGSFPLRFDTNRKVASCLAQVEYYELGLDYPERYAEFIRKVTRDDVLRVAKQYLRPDQLVTDPHLIESGASTALTRSPASHFGQWAMTRITRALWSRGARTSRAPRQRSP